MTNTSFGLLFITFIATSVRREWVKDLDAIS
jgi:hypothetical protein